MDEETLIDWIENGFPCMNCGKQVPESFVACDDENGAIFKGICKSDVCRNLPPGGNPFWVQIK